ncbi:MAG: L,D-transpeptidase [Nitrosomonadales bacterium]|nr:L,D-transpeptidase [Nitrosomonadales bacterium]
MKITIHIPTQQLELFDDAGRLLRRYAVSTAAQGAGEESGSFCTPRGRHVIRAKIGAGQPENAVFAGRRPTGEIYTPELGAQFPGRDWILSRILWLSGCEPGFNRLGKSDTMRRYIYIHGTPDSVPMGIPDSHGCVRMRNADLVELFDRVTAGTAVEIIA